MAWPARSVLRLYKLICENVCRVSSVRKKRESHFLFCTPHPCPEWATAEYFNILFLFQKTGRVLPLAKKYSRLLTYKFVYISHNCAALCCAVICLQESPLSTGTFLR